MIATSSPGLFFDVIGPSHKCTAATEIYPVQLYDFGGALDHLNPARQPWTTLRQPWTGTFSSPGECPELRTTLDRHIFQPRRMPGAAIRPRSCGTPAATVTVHATTRQQSERALLGSLSAVLSIVYSPCPQVAEVRRRSNRRAFLSRNSSKKTYVESNMYIT